MLDTGLFSANFGPYLCWTLVYFRPISVHNYMLDTGVISAIVCVRLFMNVLYFNIFKLLSLHNLLAFI